MNIININENDNDNKNNEKEYLNLLSFILKYGIKKETRNGFTYSYFGSLLRFNINNGLTFPLLTTKKVFFRGIVEELLWFLRGSVNSKELEEKGINIWKGNSTREYLDSIGLYNYPEGYLGPIYGYQWRSFNGKVDQLKYVLEELELKNSRRALISAWNPVQLKEQALPPCHLIYNFYKSDDNNLSCMMYMRSADLFLGVPFNIASTSLLVHLIASLTDCIPGKVNIVVGDAHIYDCHIEAVKEQLIREPLEPPTLKIDIPTDSTESFTINDFESTQIKLLSYKSHPKIEAPMIA